MGLESEPQPESGGRGARAEVEGVQSGDDDAGEGIGDEGGSVSSRSAFAIAFVFAVAAATWRGTERGRMGVRGRARGAGMSAGAAEVRVLSHWTSRGRVRSSAGVAEVMGEKGWGRVPVALGKARERGFTGGRTKGRSRSEEVVNDIRRVGDEPARMSSRSSAKP